MSGDQGEIIVDHLPFFYKAVVMFKKSLLSPHSCPKDHLVELVEQIMEEEQWEEVDEQLYRSLYPICRRVAEEVKGANSKGEMFGKIIHIYTMNHCYRKINKAVAKDFEKENPKPNKGKDLSLALYDLMLDTLGTRGRVFKENILTSGDQV